MRTSVDLLFEIGVEELPARLVTPLAQELARGLIQALKHAHISFASTTTYATPRRLAVLVHALDHKQPDRVDRRIGPFVAQAYDHNDQPTPALLGFARSAGAELDQLDIVTHNGKERLATSVAIEGQPTLHLLPSLLEKVAAGLQSPASMRWNDGRYTFARPVRWITALLDDVCVPCHCFGVQAGAISFGHRFIAPQAIELGQAQDYAAVLADNWVMVDPSERLQAITSHIAQEAARLGLRSLATSELLEELSGLVEYPRVLTGTVPQQFLTLPREVLLSTLVSHQRYIGLEDESGALAPKFAFVTNMPPVDEVDDAAIIAGNERVLNPRLEDAAFFWQKDCSIPLADHAQRLQTVVFETKLGTMADKSTRLVALVTQIAATVDQVDEHSLISAASLCKADLVSDLVGEFPELQGVIGGHLARHQGHPKLVADAIATHYLPKGAEDSLPGTVEGTILALADKLDHICGVFILGKQGGAESDPFGARRACLGFIQLLLELKTHLGFDQLIEWGCQQYKLDQDAQLKQSMLDFIGERLVHWYQRRGFAPGPLQAVAALELVNVHEFDKRVRFITEQRHSLAPLAQLIKRAHNILPQTTEYAPVVAEDFDAAQEQTLYQCYLKAQPRATACLKEGDYSGYVSACMSLAEPLDALFAGVMIKSGSAQQQHNRMALLFRVAQLCCQLVDVRKL